MKKPTPKLTLHRETLRSLEHDTLAGAAGGATNTCNATVCGKTCRTACHTCTC